MREGGGEGGGGGRQTGTIRNDGGFLKKSMEVGSGEGGRKAEGGGGGVMKQPGRAFTLPCDLTRAVTLSSLCEGVRIRLLSAARD